MQSVLVTGAAGALGRLVLAGLAAAGDVEHVVGVDRAPGPPGQPGYRTADLASAGLAELLEGVDTVVHLAFTPPAAANGHGGDGNLAGLQRLLDASGAIDRLVLVSSASAYGAWPNNAVPLTEDAPLRPNPGFAYAAQKAEAERLVREWSAKHPDVAVAVMRPVPALGEGWASWLAATLEAAGAPRDDEAPPTQFLHLDDLAAAVVLAARQRLDGVFNVAPDGWVSAEQVRKIAGALPRLPVPDGVAVRLGELGRGLGLKAAPEGIEPYLQHPWVVANDRLRAAGWVPRHTNEEAFVAGHEPSPWTEMSPKRRQELALAATAAVVAGAVAGAVALIRRRRR